MTATVRDPSVPRKVFVTRFTGDPSVPDMQSRHFSCAGFRAVDRDELRTCLALTPTHACSIESIGAHVLVELKAGAMTAWFIINAGLGWKGGGYLKILGSGGATRRVAL